MALQVLRLCLRADSSENFVPSDIVEGAERLTGALSVPMLSTWAKSHVGGPAWHERGSRYIRSGAGFDGKRTTGIEDSSSRQGVTSRKLLPLDLPQEVAVPETNGELGADGNGAPSTGSFRTTTDPQPSLGGISYQLCGLSLIHI